MTTTTATPARRGRRRRLDASLIVGIALVAVIVIGAILVSTVGRNFFSAGNIRDILTGMSVLGFVAIGQTLVILCASLDLSVPYVVSLSSLIAADHDGRQPGEHPDRGAHRARRGRGHRLRERAHRHEAQGERVHRHPRHGPDHQGLPRHQLPGHERCGAARVPVHRRDRHRTGADLDASSCSSSRSLGAFFLARTRTGNHMFAVGGNEQVARLSGIRTARPLIVAHMLCSITAALAGLLLASRLGVGSPTVGIQGGYDLLSIAAVVLGGTLLMGGRGSIWGTIGGVAIFAVVDNVMSVMQVNPFLKDVVRGVVIVAAVAVYTSRGLDRRRPRFTSAGPGTTTAGCRARTGGVGMTAVTSDRPSFGRRLADLGRTLVSPRGAVFLLLIVLLVAITLLNPSFAEPSQFIRFVQRVAPIAIAAIGQYFVIVGGEFDLSMGSVVTAQVVIAGNLIGQDDAKALPVFAFMLAFGAFIGLVNGLIVSFLKVPSFIVTLGMMLALLGATLYWTGGAATGNPADSFREIGRGGIRDLPVVEILPWSVVVLVVVLAGRRLVREAAVRAHDHRARRQPDHRPLLGHPELVGQDVDVHHLVARRDARRRAARRVRGRAPQRRPRLRVHRDHGGRARRGRARRRTRLGRRRGGRRLRPRGAVHPAELRRRALDATATRCRAPSSSSRSPTRRPPSARAVEAAPSRPRRGPPRRTTLRRHRGEGARSLSGSRSPCINSLDAEG